VSKVSSKDNLEKESQWWETLVLWVVSCIFWKGVEKCADVRFFHLLFVPKVVPHSSQDDPRSTGLDTDSWQYCAAFASATAG